MKNAVIILLSIVCLSYVVRDHWRQSSPPAPSTAPSTSWSSPQAEADSKKHVLEFMDGMRRGMRVGYLVGQSGQPFEPFMEATEKGWAELMKKNYPEARP